MCMVDRVNIAMMVGGITLFVYVYGWWCEHFLFVCMVGDVNIFCLHDRWCKHCLSVSMVDGVNIVCL